jgi:hypothetical protein
MRVGPGERKQSSLSELRQQITDRRMLALPVGVAGGVLFPVLGSGLSPLAAAAGLVGMVVAVFALFNPFIPVVLTALVVPIERLGRFSNDSSAVTISLMRIFGLLGVASLGLNWLLKRHQLSFPSPLVIYAVYTVICAFSLTYGTDEKKGLSYVITMVGNLLFLLLVVNVIRKRADVRLPVVLWLITTLGVGIFSIYQWHNPNAVVRVDRFDYTGERTTDERFSTVMEDYAEFEAIGKVRRVLGVTSHPAVYGINIILTMPFYIWLLRTSRNWLMLGFCLFGVGVGSYNVMLTNTRAAVLTLAFAFLVCLLTGLMKIRPIVIIGGVLLGALMVPFFPSTLYDRILNASNYSTEKSAAMRVRLTYWETGIEMFRENWLLGIGAGNQSELPRRLKPKMSMPANTSIHNEYFQSLMETGLLGYPFFVTFLVCLYRCCTKTEKMFRLLGDESSRLFVVAARAGYIAVLAYGLQCDVLHFTLKGWWLAMGLVIALSEIAVYEMRKRLDAQSLTSSEPVVTA